MSKIAGLTHALFQKTMEKKLKWDIQDKDSIIIHIGSNSVTIDGVPPVMRLSNHLYRVAIQNLDGETVDEQSFSPLDDLYNKISEMMVLARRNVMRADETIDELMDKISRM